MLFTGTDYQIAKAGLDVMDQLAELVDRPTAIAAANWSEAKVAQMVAECRAQCENVLGAGTLPNAQVEPHTAALQEIANGQD